MSLAGLLFMSTVIMVMALHLRRQIPFYRAVSMLEAALTRDGVDWSYWGDLDSRSRFLSNPSTIFRETDTAEIRTLKQALVDRRADILRGLPQLLMVFACGFGLTCAAMVAQVYMRSGK